MQTIHPAQNGKITWQGFRNSPAYANQRDKTLNGMKNLVIGLFRLIVIAGISYVILAPVINIISNSFFSRFPPTFVFRSTNLCANPFMRDPPHTQCSAKPAASDVDANGKHVRHSFL